jgi:hypothetical protein
MKPEFLNIIYPMQDVSHQQCLNGIIEGAPITILVVQSSNPVLVFNKFQGFHDNMKRILYEAGVDRNETFTEYHRYNWLPTSWTRKRLMFEMILNSFKCVRWSTTKVLSSASTSIHWRDKAKRVKNRTTLTILIAMVSEFSCSKLLWFQRKKYLVKLKQLTSCTSFWD